MNHGRHHATGRVLRAAPLGQPGPGVDTARRDGVPTDTAREIRELKRKNRKLEETIEILEAAAAFVPPVHAERLAPVHHRCAK